MAEGPNREAAAGIAAWALVRYLAITLEATDAMPKGAVDRAISDALLAVRELVSITEADPQSLLAFEMMEMFQKHFREWVANDYVSPPPGHDEA